MDRRALLLSGLAAGALAAVPAAANPPNPVGDGADTGVATASVQRLDASRVRLAWSGFSGPVRVLASSDPVSPANLMRVISDRSRKNGLEVALSASPRPYFLLESSGGSTVRAAERLLPLEAGRNFRDLGGYRTADGRQVRWGRLYRSGVMSGLTANDLTYLAGLGIETVCDLRSSDERKTEPPPFKGAGAPETVAFDYAMDMTMSSMGAMFAAKTREEAVKAFAASYLQMAEFLTPHFKDMFGRLLRREAPLAINCSAGKDRTGLGSALILSVLGAPRDTVIADYALSETFVPVDKYIRDMNAPAAGQPNVMSDQQRALFSRMPEAVLRVLMGSDADVMRITLAEIDARFGGPVALVKARYGLDDAGIDYLRGVYVA